MVNLNSPKWYKIKVLVIVLPFLIYGSYDYLIHGSSNLNMISIFGSLGVGLILYILGKRHFKIVHCVKCNTDIKVGMNGNLPKFHRKGNCKK